MKALVTGANGFIGSALVAELNVLGFDVYALLRRNSDTDLLEGLRYEPIMGDLNRPETYRNALPVGIDYVFHLANVRLDATRGFLNILTHASRPVSRLIHLSSVTAGGPAHSIRPMTERDKSEPVSSHGVGMLRSEKEVLGCKDRLPVTIIRAPLVYGPGNSWVLPLVKAMARNFFPLVRGTQSPQQEKYYSLIYVKDLCRGLVQAALAREVPSGEVFYLTDDGIHTFRELLQAIADAIECDPIQIPLPKPLLRLVAAGMTAVSRVTRQTSLLNLDTFNELEADYWICSSEKAKTLLGFHPETPLSEGIAASIEWYKARQWI